MSAGWNWYVIIFTVANILACFWLIRYTSTFKAEQKEKGETTGHVWDGDLEEYSNPLPRWWLWLFYITIVFALVYMAFYPGLGNYKGMFGWSQQGQYEDEMAAADQQFAPIFASYAKKPIPELAKDEIRLILKKIMYLFFYICLNLKCYCISYNKFINLFSPSVRKQEW